MELCPADNKRKATPQAYRGERICRAKGMKRLSISDLSTTGTYFREAVAPADNMSAAIGHSAKRIGSSMVERLICNQRVGSSSLLRCSKGILLFYFSHGETTILYLNGAVAYSVFLPKRYQSGAIIARRAVGAGRWQVRPALQITKDYSPNFPEIFY